MSGDAVATFVMQGTRRKARERLNEALAEPRRRERRVGRVDVDGIGVAKWGASA